MWYFILLLAAVSFIAFLFAIKAEDYSKTAEKCITVSKGSIVLAFLILILEFTLWKWGFINDLF